MTGVLLLWACSQDIPLPESSYEVPAEVQPHIDAFVEEADLRGKTINTDNLVVTLGANLHEGAAATCKFYQDQKIPTINIDTTSASWRNNYYTREALIFHELGHLYLGRLSHRDDFMPNGDRASIMNSRGAQFFGAKLTYFKRKYYLDELFDESVVFPDWAIQLPAYEDIPESQKQLWFTDRFVDNRSGWTVGKEHGHTLEIKNGNYFLASGASAFLVSQDVPLDESRNFEIEVRMKLTSGERSALIQWGGSGKDNYFFYGFTHDQTMLLGKKDRNWPSSLADSKKVSSLSPNDWNVLSIRKQGDKYYFFVNYGFVDIASYSPFEGKSIGFYVGSASILQISQISIYYL